MIFTTACWLGEGYGLSKYVVAPVADGPVDNEYFAHTRRTRLIAITVLSLAYLLAGCASRPEVGALLANHEMNAVGKDHTVLVATTRDRDPRPGTYFGGERSEFCKLCNDHGGCATNPRAREDRMAVKGAGQSGDGFCRA